MLERWGRRFRLPVPVGILANPSGGQPPQCILKALPELPDITVYIEALESRILSQRLERIRIATPFLLRTTDPPPAAAEGRIVTALRRVGKRIAIGFDNDVWLVLHLMI